MDPLHLALELTSTVLVIVVVLCVALLVLIVVAPWKRVRDEPPLDPDDEAELLLRRDPDNPTGDLPAARAAELTDFSDAVDSAGDASYDDLRNL